MTIDESLKNATTGVALVGEILKAAGENPNVKEAGQHLGKAGLTIAKTINNALLPLAAVNFAFDKARKYFAEKFEEDISLKASKIPPEDLIEPKASIAGPTLQGLEHLKSIHEKDGRTLIFTNGIMTRTALGIQFAKSVGLA